MAVHAELDQPIVDPAECLARHSRILKDATPVYRGALVGLAQLEDDEEKNDEILNQRQRWFAAGKVLKPVQTRLADLPPARFAVALPRLRRILDAFVERMNYIQGDEDPNRSFSKSVSPQKPPRKGFH